MHSGLCTLRQFFTIYAVVRNILFLQGVKLCSCSLKEDTLDKVNSWELLWNSRWVSTRQKSVSANAHKQLCIVFQSDTDGNQALAKVAHSLHPLNMGSSIRSDKGRNTTTSDSLKNQTTVVELPQSHCVWDNYSIGLPSTQNDVSGNIHVTCILLPTACLEQEK